MADQLRLQVLLNAIDRVSAPMARITGGANAMRTALSKTTHELSDLNRQSAAVESHSKLTAALKDITQQLDGAKHAVETQTDAVSRLRNEQNAIAGKTRAARAALRAHAQAVSSAHTPTAHLTQSYERQKSELETLEKSYHSATNALRNARSQQRETVRTAQQLTAKQQRQSEALGQLEQQLQHSGVNTAQLADHQRHLHESIQRTNQTLSEQRRALERLAAIHAKSRQLQSLGQNASIAGAGMSYVGHRAFALAMTPVQRYAEQETAFTQLQAALMDSKGTIAPEFAKINALANDLGNVLPGTTSDFINLMTVLSKQGISAQTILNGTGKAAAYLAVQLRMPVEEAGEFTAKMQDATRSTEAEMLHLADQMQRLSYMGVDKTNMLGFFGKASPALSILHMKGEEAVKALAPLAYMTDQSAMEGGAAGNATRKILQSVMKTDKVDSVNDALKDLNLKIHLNFTDGHGEFGGIDQLYRQLEQLGKLNTETRLGVIKKIFGDDAETLQVLTLMIDKGAAGYRDAQQRLAAQASLEQRVTKELGTLTNLWDAASGTFINGLSSIGHAMAPDIANLIHLLNAASQRFSDWAQANPRLAATLGKIAIGVTVIGTALGGFLLTLGVALMGFGQLVKGAGLVVTVFEVLAPLVVGISAPVWALGAALVGAALLIWRYWEPIKDFFSALWDGIATGAQNLPGILATLWATIQAQLDRWPANMLNAGLQLMSGLLQGIMQVSGRIGAVLSGVFSTALDQLKGVFGFTAPPSHPAVQTTRPAFAGLPLPSGGMPATAAAATPPGHTIHIHGTAGMDPQAVARAVSSELDRRDRAHAASRRSRLTDGE